MLLYLFFSAQFSTSGAAIPFPESYQQLPTCHCKNRSDLIKQKSPACKNVGQFKINNKNI
jgi:hypothetical protein